MEDGEKVKALQAEKTRLIEHYLRMQDEADELNGRIYQLCCEIEAMNAKITIAEHEAQLLAAKKAAAAAAAPPNGNGRSKA